MFAAKAAWERGFAQTEFIKACKKLDPNNEGSENGFCFAMCQNFKDFFLIYLENDFFNLLTHLKSSNSTPVDETSVKQILKDFCTQTYVMQNAQTDIKSEKDTNGKLWYSNLLPNEKVDVPYAMGSYSTYEFINAKLPLTTFWDEIGTNTWRTKKQKNIEIKGGVVPVLQHSTTIGHLHISSWKKMKEDFLNQKCVQDGFVAAGEDSDFLFEQSPANMEQSIKYLFPAIGAPPSDMSYEEIKGTYVQSFDFVPEDRPVVALLTQFFELAHEANEDRIMIEVGHNDHGVSWGYDARNCK